MSRTRLRAVLLLLVYATLLLASAPGVGGLGSEGLSERLRRRALRQGFPEVLVDLVDALSQVNRLRAPALERISPILFHPLRIGQGWALYGDGPDQVYRIEVYTDEALRYRSGDRDHDWLRYLMHDGRLRPSFDDMTTRPGAPNNRGLLTLLAERARAEDPGVSAVEVRVTVSPFPGDRERPKHGWRMEAPGWEPERLPR